MVCSVSHSLTKPLNGGNAAMESAPARKAKRGQRHPSDQAAELVHVARAGLIFHRARAEKQQRFVKGVIDKMIQGRRRRQSPPAPDDSSRQKPCPRQNRR